MPVGKEDVYTTDHKVDIKLNLTSSANQDFTRTTKDVGMKVKLTKEAPGRSGSVKIPFAGMQRPWLPIDFLCEHNIKNKEGDETDNLGDIGLHWKYYSDDDGTYIKVKKNRVRANVQRWQGIIPLIDDNIGDPKSWVNKTLRSTQAPAICRKWRPPPNGQTCQYPLCRLHKQL